jgi:hypothetical protein
MASTVDNIEGLHPFSSSNSGHVWFVVSGKLIESN